jgi:2-succinyl-6-hydroxy-2,4-cyclohexadiene-1-carboxylate synthase
VTIAFLHGFAGDAAIWDAIRMEFSASRAISLPGHGTGLVRSSWDANLEAVAGEVGDTLVVGYSLGARIALGLVATGRCKRAILISVNPGIPDAERAARRASDAAWAQMLRTRGLAEFLEAWEAQPLFATQSRVSPERLTVRRARRLALDPEQLARSLEIMGLAEMPDYRGELDERVAMIAGADDPKYAAIARASGVRHAIIAGAGHDIPLEQPAALVAAIAKLS